MRNRASAVLLAPVILALTTAFADKPNTQAIVPLAIVVPALVLALFSPIAGWLADRFGRRSMLIAALAVYSVVGTAPMWLATLPQIILSRGLPGVCESIIVISSTALIGDCFFGPDREKWLAAQAGISALSAILFIVIGGALGENGWRAPFAAYGIAVFFIIPILMFIREPQRHEQPQVAQKVDYRLFGWISLIAIIASIMFMVVPIQIGFLLAAQGITSPQMIGLATAAGSLAVPVGAYMFRRLSHRPFALLGAAGLVFMAVGLAIMAKSPSFGVTVAGSIVHGFGWGIGLPTVLTWAMAQLHFDLRGRGTGVFMAAVFVGQFISPVAVIGLQAATGALTTAVLVMAGLALIAGVLTATFGRRLRGV